MAMIGYKGFPGAGLYVRDGSTGRILTFGFQMRQGDLRCGWVQWNNVSTWGGTENIESSADQWDVFQMSYDGTGIILRHSPMGTEPLEDAHGTGSAKNTWVANPSEFGIFVNAQSNTSDVIGLYRAVRFTASAAAMVYGGPP